MVAMLLHNNIILLLILKIKIFLINFKCVFTLYKLAGIFRCPGVGSAAVTNHNFFHMIEAGAVAPSHTYVP